MVKSKSLKKFLVAISIMGLTLSVVGCSSSNNSKDETSETKVEASNFTPVEFTYSDGVFDKGNRNADRSTPNYNDHSHPPGNAFLPEPGGCNPQRIAHMKGRTDAGVGIHRIDDAKKLCQNIVSGKHIRAQILPVGENDIHRHSDNLGDDDIGLQFLEAVHAVEQKIQQRSHDQQIPAHIRNDEPFAERHHIIQPTINRIAVFFRNQILSKKIQDKVSSPSQ